MSGIDNIQIKKTKDCKNIFLWEQIIQKMGVYFLINYTPNIQERGKSLWETNFQVIAT